MKRIFAIVIFIVCIAISQIANAELFGLKWGMSLDEVKKITKSEMVLLSTANNMNTYGTKIIENGFADAEMYGFSFYNGVLAKLTMVTTSFKNDYFGESGKKRFNELLEIAEQSGYVKEDDFRFIGASLYKDPDEFYECLRYEKCGAWAVFLKKGETGMLIAIKGEGSGAGYVTLTTENLSQIEKALNEVQEQRSSSDRKAFGK